MKKKTWEYIITVVGIIIGIVDIILINGGFGESNALPDDGIAEVEAAAPIETELLVDLTGIDLDEAMEEVSSWVWPVTGKYYITSRYGPRWGRMHSGVDIAQTGYRPKIRAVQAGTIIVNSYGRGYGHYVVIDHDNGYYTLYAHFSKKSTLAVGTKVEQSQVVGYMGCTGNCTGQHLHLSVLKGESYKKSKYINPCKSIYEC